MPEDTATTSAAIITLRPGRYSPLYSWLSVCRKNPRTFSMESLVTASLYSNRCPPEFIPVRKPQPRQIKPVKRQDRLSIEPSNGRRAIVRCQVRCALRSSLRTPTPAGRSCYSAKRDRPTPASTLISKPFRDYRMHHGCPSQSTRASADTSGHCSKQWWAGT